MTYKPGQRIKLSVTRNCEPNFDRACEYAYSRAMATFGCDEDGHLNNVQDSVRSRDSVVVEFRRYRCVGGMGGQACEYLFEAWVERAEEET